MKLLTDAMFEALSVSTLEESRKLLAKALRDYFDPTFSSDFSALDRLASQVEEILTYEALEGRYHTAESFRMGDVNTLASPSHISRVIVRMRETERLKFCREIDGQKADGRSDGFMLPVGFP